MRYLFYIGLLGAALSLGVSIIKDFNGFRTTKLEPHKTRLKRLEDDLER